MANSERFTFPFSDEVLFRRVAAAVTAYWTGRGGQSERQVSSGASDVGTRSEVTGGSHLNSFVELLCEVVTAAGFQTSEISFKTGVELPGYFRPQKKWDIVVIRNGRLCAALELKSQSGSFGNNFNNRTEEAIGSATDLWTAFREGAIGRHQPWLGYFFLLEDSAKSTRPVSLKPSIFPVMSDFQGTSYAQRYAILCQRLVLERKYTAAALIIAPRGSTGVFSEPDESLGLMRFIKSLHGHLIGCS